MNHTAYRDPIDQQSKLLFNGSEFVSNIDGAKYPVINGIPRFLPDYIQNYSENFEVPGNQSRQTWEAMRRTRLTKPRYIKLKIDYKKFELIDTNVVDVFFQQNYRSNTYSDQTNKVLRLSKEGKDWKILLERSR